MIRTPALAAIAIAVLSTPLAAPAQCFEEQITGGPGNSRTGMKHEVLFLDDDTILAGAHWRPSPLGGGGVVDVYRRTDEGWAFDRALFPPDPDNASSFGYAIAQVGDEPRVLIGDPGVGLVWDIARRDQRWVVLDRLEPPDQPFGRFGWSIAYDQGRAAIGAPRRSAAHVYTLGDTGWTHERTFRPDEDWAGMGHGVHLDGNRLVIGGTGQSPVEIWRRGFTTWMRIAQILPPDDRANTFGHEVLLWGDFLAVSQPDPGVGSRVLIYEEWFAGYWRLRQTLSPWDAAEFDWPLFGNDLEFHDGALYIQALHATDFNGATYAFRDSGQGVWFPWFKVTPSDPGRHADAANIALRGDLLAMASVNSADPMRAPVDLFNLRPRCLCPADFNEDGRVNTLDVTAFLTAWNNADEAADVNGDGAIDSRDLVWFLHEWNTRANCR
jgi:hypothetical protein